MSPFYLSQDVDILTDGAVITVLHLSGDFPPCHQVYLRTFLLD